MAKKERLYKEDKPVQIKIIGTRSEADTLFFSPDWQPSFDFPWNPFVIEQRIRRTYRHGQDKPVFVINMILSNHLFAFLAVLPYTYSNAITVPLLGNIIKHRVY